MWTSGGGGQGGRSGSSQTQGDGGGRRRDAWNSTVEKTVSFILSVLNELTSPWWTYRPWKQIPHPDLPRSEGPRTIKVNWANSPMATLRAHLNIHLGTPFSNPTLLSIHTHTNNKVFLKKKKKMKWKARSFLLWITLRMSQKKLSPSFCPHGWSASLSIY